MILHQDFEKILTYINAVKKNDNKLKTKLKGKF